MVGYRGVDGSSVLNCPEVTAALEKSADFLAKASLSAYSKAFASCAKRLERSGVDLAGYTLAEQADDIEAARVALGYQRIDLVSESEGTRLAMIYSWMYPNSVDRSAMIGVNPPGNFLYSGSRDRSGDRGLLGAVRASSLPAAPAPPTSPPACSTRRQTCRSSGTSCRSSRATSWSGRSSGSPTRPRKEVTPLSGPMTLDSWISAAHGDPSGFWLLSEMAGLILPTSFVWGEFASIGLADAQPAERYFSSGADRGSIIGNPGTQFL